MAKFTLMVIPIFQRKKRGDHDTIPGFLLKGVLSQKVTGNMVAINACSYLIITNMVQEELARIAHDR